MDTIKVLLVCLISTSAVVLVLIGFSRKQTHIDCDGNGVEVSTELSKEQASRLTRVKQECEKFTDFLKKQSWRDSVPHMIVDDERKVLFCPIPKVASSNWKRVFINSLNITVDGSSVIPNVHVRGLLPDLRYFSREEQEKRLKTYFKFTFVRDPLERLLSAFRNKLEHKDIALYTTEKHQHDGHGGIRHFTDKVFKVITQRSQKMNITPAHMTFAEFVSNLTDPKFTIRRYNTHWKQYHKLCHPCFVKYDFIGKMENFQEDSDFVHKKTGLELKPWFREEYQRSTTMEVSQQYYSTISDRNIRTLMRMYESDMSMFNYE